MIAPLAPKDPTDVLRGVASHSEATAGRLFFALWPPHETAMALHALGCRQATSTGGRVTRIESIHLTIAFLGDVAASRIEVFRSLPPEIVAPAFSMHVDQVGHWVRNGIVWAAPTAVPDALASLQARLAAWVTVQGIVLDTRPFRPHVTLLRKAARGELTEPEAPIRWTATDFVLVRSGHRADGSGYETIARFPLNPSSGNPS